MQSAIPHRIRRQKWLVSVHSSDTAFQLRSKLHDRWESILPVFDKAFNKLDSNNRVIRIPKIELNIKAESEENLVDSVLEKLSQQIDEKLSILFEKNYYLDNSIQWRDSDILQSNFEKLLFYLKKGSLPWHAFNEIGKTSGVPGLLEIYLEQKHQFISYLQTHNQSAAFWFRLFQIIGNNESTNIATHLASQIKHSWNDDLNRLIDTVFKSDTTIFSKYIQLNLAAAILSEALAVKNIATKPDFSLISETTLMPENSQVLINFIGGIPTELHLFFKELIGANKDKIPEVIAESDLSVFKKNMATQSFLNDEDTDQQNNLILNEETSEIVPFAGLIILNPFLIKLFENEGIKDPEKFDLSLCMLPRAAALLHYLATGTEEIFEYDLAFIKILLGLSPTSQLPVSEGLLDFHNKKEADTVLQSAIEYWSALKNTSINGLRSTFVRRNGLLKSTDNEWFIKIERKTFDLLLDKLPWSISIVKLPWMTKAIYTEW